MSEAKIRPRAERNCSNCDASLVVAPGKMECRLRPMNTVYVGLGPKDAAQAGPLLVPNSAAHMEHKFIAVIAPASPHYCCIEGWREMRADHPNYPRRVISRELPAIIHEAPEKRQ